MEDHSPDLQQMNSLFTEEVNSLKAQMEQNPALSQKDAIIADL
jgi:hypothetical protein